MSEQLTLFEAPPPNGNGSRGGSTGFGPVGLLKALQQQGLAPDATVPAAKLIALLDEDAGGKR